MVGGGLEGSTEESGFLGIGFVGVTVFRLAVRWCVLVRAKEEVSVGDDDGVGA